MLRLLRFARPGAPAAPDAAVGIDPHAELAALAARGDRTAQRTLLVTVGPPLLRVVRGVLGSRHPDVEDVLQEAMAAVHAALPGFRGECRVLHFACRVAVQTALAARRRAGYRQRITPATAPDALADVPSGERSPGEAHRAAECRRALRHLLDELPEPQAEALVLHTVLGYSLAETADAQRVPLNTARSRLRTALASLRARVAADPALLSLLEPER